MVRYVAHAKAAATWKKAETRKERDIIKWCEIMSSGTLADFLNVRRV